MCSFDFILIQSFVLLIFEYLSVRKSWMCSIRKRSIKGKKEEMLEEKTCNCHLICDWNVIKKEEVHTKYGSEGPFGKESYLGIYKGDLRINKPDFYRTSLIFCCHKSVTTTFSFLRSTWTVWASNTALIPTFFAINPNFTNPRSFIINVLLYYWLSISTWSKSASETRWEGRTSCYNTLSV